MRKNYPGEIDEIDFDICYKKSYNSYSLLKNQMAIHISMFFILIYAECFEGTNKVSPVIHSSLFIVGMFLQLSQQISMSKQALEIESMIDFRVQPGYTELGIVPECFSNN